MRQGIYRLEDEVRHWGDDDQADERVLQEQGEQLENVYGNLRSQDKPASFRRVDELLDADEAVRIAAANPKILMMTLYASPTRAP